METEDAQIGPTAYQPVGEAGALTVTGTADDGAFPCCRLRGLPFDVQEEEIRSWIVSGAVPGPVPRCLAAPLAAGSVAAAPSRRGTTRGVPPAEGGRKRRAPVRVRACCTPARRQRRSAPPLPSSPRPRPPPPQGVDPIDVLLVKRDGRPSGEAYLLFGSAASVPHALARDKGYLGRRYVEVFKAKKLVGPRGGGGAA